MAKKEMQLKVGEIPSNAQSDIGIGIVRLDTRKMNEIGVREGDIVEVEGKRKTGAIAVRPYPSDSGLDVIRMDGYLRRNAGTSIGESVIVRKAEILEAKKVTVAPAEKGVLLQVQGDQIKRMLLGRVVTKGDMVAPVTRRQRQAFPFGELFDMNIEDMFSFGFGEMRFTVVDTNPKGIVKITDLTEVDVLSQAVEVREEEAALPVITYEDIGGLREEVKKVREMIELPLKHPELFERVGIEPPKGVLLYGPPGTGKTLLARAVANESGANFVSINGPEVTSKWYGESEKKIREIFEQAQKNAPTIIFIDEIDSIAPKREEVTGEVERRMVAQLLASLDGLQSRGQVIVIAATNRPNALDPAIRRPGRLDREIELGVPDRDGRKEILQIHTRTMPIKADLDSELVKEHLERKIEEELKKLKLDKEELDTKIKEYQKVAEDKGALNAIKNKLLGVEKKLGEMRKVKEALDRKDQMDKLVSFIIENERALLLRDSYDPRNYFYKKNIETANAEVIKLAIETEFISPDDLAEIQTKGRDKMLGKLADVTHGYVGADLAALAREAAMSTLRKILPKINLEERIPPEILKNLEVTMQDFNNALMFVEPSAMREVLVEVPKVTWNDIGGLDEVKQYLKEMVEWPLHRPEAFKRMGIRPPKGILLYGLPGTGKTLLAKAVANESEANFISVKGPELLSKWVGESEKHVREMFKRAKQVAPSIIFLDEIDALAPRRGSHASEVTDQVVTQLLSEMDGLEGLKGVVVIGATNRPDMIDSALLRPGRFDRHVYIPVPDEKTRRKIFDIHTKNMPLAKDVSIDALVKDTDGFVGADIEALCREAAIVALREDIKAKEVRMKDFEEALKKIKASAKKEDIMAFKKKVEETKKIQNGGEELSYVG